MGLGTIWLLFSFTLFRFFFFLFVKIVLKRYMHTRKIYRVEETKKKKERTQLYNDGREIDFRDEQHTHTNAENIEEKHLLSRARGRACTHTHAHLCALYSFSPSNGRRAKEEKKKKKNEEKRRKKKNREAAIVTRAGNQASERCRYILYWTRKSSNKAKD